MGATYRTLDEGLFHQLQQDGLSTRATAARLGVTERTVQRHRAIHGYSTPSPATANRVTPEWREWANQLAADGASQVEIARTTGVTHQTVHRHLPDAKWDQKTVGTHAAAIRRLNHQIGKANVMPNKPRFPAWGVLVKAAGAARGQWVTPTGGLNGLRVHALAIRGEDAQQRANEYAVQITQQNPTYQATARTL